MKIMITPLRRLAAGTAAAALTLHTAATPTKAVQPTRNYSRPGTEQVKPSIPTQDTKLSNKPGERVRFGNQFPVGYFDYYAASQAEIDQMNNKICQEMSGGQYSQISYETYAPAAASTATKAELQNLRFHFQCKGVERPNIDKSKVKKLFSSLRQDYQFKNLGPTAICKEQADAMRRHNFGNFTNVVGIKTIDEISPSGRAVKIVACLGLESKR
ncbi:MAG: hypothetical protein QNJ31_09295 [Candidatus Caenarcaniphilales bacterium]|nr:hypothetical protein [Candidatus Caenarcaniphilales bacterium]